MENTDAKFMFPAYPIMHCGLGDNYVEYPLSKVLGSWGATIRDIWFEGKGVAVVRSYQGKDGDVSEVAQLEIMPISAFGYDLPLRAHCMDLILRYERDDKENLLTPTWTKAIWMNTAMCHVVDAIKQISHDMRFIDVEESTKQ